MLDRANSKTPPEYPPRVEYVHADMFGYEPSAPYDLILCIGVLAHVDSIDGAVEKMARSVKPGGRVVVQISDGDQYLLRLQRSLQAVRNIARIVASACVRRGISGGVRRRPRRLYKPQAQPPLT